MKGYGKASGAGTIINAIATYKGCAFGIDLWTHAKVEVGGDIKGIHGKIKEGGDPGLIEKCVELVLKKFDCDMGAYVETESEIPIARGLKSSSAAANATVFATVDAIGEEINVMEGIRLGVKAAIECGVSITGAFDDACAAMLEGIVITDNKKNELIKRVEKKCSVLIFVPEEKTFTSETNISRIRLIAPWVEIAYKLALDEEFELAMTLNGFLYCGVLGFDTNIMISALEAGARGVSLSGTGSSFTALVDEERIKDVKDAWEEFGGRVLVTEIRRGGLR